MNVGEKAADLFFLDVTHLVVVVDEPVSLRTAEETDGALPDLVLDATVHREGPGAPGDDDVRQSEARGEGRAR